MKHRKYSHSEEECYRNVGYPADHTINRSVNFAAEEKAFFAGSSYPENRPVDSASSRNSFFAHSGFSSDDGASQENCFPGGPTPDEYDVFPPPPEPEPASPTPETESTDPGGTAAGFSAPIFLLLALFSFLTLGVSFGVSLLLGSVSASSPFVTDQFTLVTDQVTRLGRALYGTYLLH